HQLVHKYKVALPLRADRGTSPNVYYIPPTEAPPKFDAEGNVIEGSNRIPVEELEKLFGTEVNGAIKTLKAEMAKRKETGKSELLDLLIAYSHSDMFRLDNNYYKKEGSNKLAPVDNRYLSGKHTQKITRFLRSK
ncbi:MAG: respiratory nitrate reductase subunit beta, partial [Arcobacteraceae bacterium]